MTRNYHIPETMTKVNVLELLFLLSQIKSPEELDGYNLGPLAPDAATVNLVSRLITTYGGVPVSGKNMFQLLKRGEHVLLYPGGVREVLQD